MPTLSRPDGVEIHWESHGEGPPALIVPGWAGMPDILDGLIRDLSEDHRVLLFHPRGVGRSTRVGPYDVETDVADVVALLEEAGDGPAVGIALADGVNRALRVAAWRPDLLDAVVTPSGVPLTEELLDGSSSLASPAVIEAVGQQVRSDYRGATRMIVASNNPQLGEDAVRERVAMTMDFCPQEAAVGRYDAWINDDPGEYAREVGDRLVVLVHEGNPWFPPDLAERARAFFPDMQVRYQDDGVLSRPDLTAEAVRSLVRARV